MHVMFRHAEGIANSASKIAPHVDVRGEGGYIIWWPAAGFGQMNQGAVLCPFPDWLLSLLKPKKMPRQAHETYARAKTSNRYVARALERAYDAVSFAGEGCRNDTLNRETYALARFVRDGVLRESEISNAMTSAALSAGLEPREIEATIASAFRARAN